MPSRDPENRIREVVEIFALPAAQAVARMPGDDRAPDTLAVRFDEAYTLYMGAMSKLPSEAQLLSLQALDSELCALSDSRNTDLWTTRSYGIDPRWGMVRELAAEVLRAFGW